jgi:uncharacterized protein YuzE
MTAAKSVNGVRIRLTSERWVHITEEHCEMAGHFFEVLEALEEPEVVVYKEDESMAALNLEQIMDLAPQLLRLPSGRMWASFDAEADVLYVNFKKPSHADDSELTEQDILIRYEKGEIVGVTILRASRWLGQ